MDRRTPLRCDQLPSGCTYYIVSVLALTTSFTNRTIEKTTIPPRFFEKNNLL